MSPEAARHRRRIGGLLAAGLLPWDYKREKTMLDEIRGQVATHPPTDVCPDMECLVCGLRDCPHQDPLHYHHDGCPSCCAQDESDQMHRENDPHYIKTDDIMRQDPDDPIPPFYDEEYDPEEDNDCPYCEAQGCHECDGTGEYEP